MPDATDACQATLTIGKDNNEMIDLFWGGVLEEDSKLLKLIRLLEMI